MSKPSTNNNNTENNHIPPVNGQRVIVINASNSTPVPSRNGVFHHAASNSNLNFNIQRENTNNTTIANMLNLNNSNNNGSEPPRSPTR